MRENLFKGKVVAGYKHIAEGEWVEGSLFYTDDEYGTVCYIATSYLSSDRGEPMMVVAYEVDPETVCRYTGLTDKNDRKIFEEDIVKHDISGTIGKVKWYQEDYIGWCVDDVWIDEQQFTNEMWNECEVIGNIFDNPDLLKE